MWQVLNRTSIRTKFITAFTLAFIWTLSLGWLRRRTDPHGGRSAAVLRDDVLSSTIALKRIAAKTNLLALNATTEAARAGDAGKGLCGGSPAR